MYNITSLIIVISIISDKIFHITIPILCFPNTYEIFAPLKMFSLCWSRIGTELYETSGQSCIA